MKDYIIGGSVFMQKLGQFIMIIYNQAGCLAYYKYPEHLGSVLRPYGTLSILLANSYITIDLRVLLYFLS